MAWNLIAVILAIYQCIRATLDGNEYMRTMYDVDTHKSSDLSTARI